MRTPVILGRLSARDLAVMLDASKRGGSEWYDGKCPAHDDERASLSFCDGDRALIVHCHRGCDYQQIAAALRKPDVDFIDGSGATPPPLDFSTLSIPVKTYHYRNAAGEVVHRTVRYRPKSFKQERPDGRGGWIPNLDGVEL